MVRHSIGISDYAGTLETRYGLRDKTYMYIETFEWLIGKLAAYFQIDTPEVKYGRLAQRRRGYYRHFPDHGAVILNSGGMCLGTALHEFAHHLQRRRGLSFPSHGSGFKQCHEDVLNAFLEDHIMENWDDIDYIEHANKLWETMPTMYESVWYEGIPTRELVEKLDGFKKGEGEL